MTLPVLMERWLESLEGSIGDGTIGMCRMHFEAHLMPHFGAPGNITTATINEFARKRLKVVKRKTVQKERSTLRSFMSWCHESGYLPSPPAMPPMPWRQKGTPFAVRRRGKATDIEPEEARAIIAALPSWSKARLGVPAFPVRARFIVMYETALRPATLNVLSVPEHYTRGSSKLVIADEIDKARYGRELPLSRLAQEALDSVARGSGLIFGKHDYRNHLERAAKLVLKPEKAATFCAYDFRHTRATELADGGDMRGVMYVLGHKNASTTDVYVRPNFKAAKKVLGLVSDTPTRVIGRLVGVPKRHDLIPITARRAKTRGRTGTGFIPPEPESTHTDPGCALTLGDRALAIIESAAGQVPPDPDAVIEFVRDALTADALGQLALGVLEGGPFALLHLVRLAELVVERDAKVTHNKGAPVASAGAPDDPAKGEP